MIKRNNRGFTLAEILITLAVIGAIAALTIPVLVQDVQEAQLKTAWKSAFANMSQATMRLNTENGSIDFTDSASMRDSYANVMKVISKNNWNNIAPPFYFYYKSSQGRDYSGDTTPSVILLNGNLLRFYSFGKQSGNWGSGPAVNFCTATSGSLSGICGIISIDINGKKAPNMYGKDYFYIWIVQKNGSYIAYSFGSNGDTYDCEIGSANSDTSIGCSALALYTDKMP